MPRKNKQLNHQSSISRVMKQVVEPHHQWLNQTTNLSSPATPAPPNALPAAYNEAHALTQQLHRMVFADGLPIANSQGLERLLFRMVRVNEALVGVLNEVLARQPSLATAQMNEQGALADEVYQPSYCDVCGEELTPDGDCISPSCPEF